jgi:chemotaxis protein methyltransferase CheR
MTAKTGEVPVGGLDNTALIPIDDEEFNLIRGLIYERFGINLTPAKRALVRGRLQQMLRERGQTTFRGYYEFVLADATGRELSDLANRISTNHTYFNREKDHFDLFRREVLPEIIARKRRAGSRNLRIWCAASSTGEEPYMLAMQMMDVLGSDYGNWDAGILATDISERALQEAGAGVYDEERIRELPPELRVRFFFRSGDGRYQAQDWLRKEVTFRRFNLIGPEFPFRRPFDVIFCRNVMIYFDNPTKDALVKNMHRFTQPGGYFFIGHSEALDRRTCPYTFRRPGVYRKEDGV